MNQRHYSQAAAACKSALSSDPSHVDLRLILAESLMSLRRDAEAQVEVAVALRERPRCSVAYRLLGALAFRRDELRAAEIFLREALRVAPGNRQSSDLLDMVRSRQTPAAAAAKLPAASAAAGTFSQDPETQIPGSYSTQALVPGTPRRNVRARGTEPEPCFDDKTAPRPRTPRRETNAPQAIVARGSAPIETSSSFDVDIDVEGATDVDDALMEASETVERPRMSASVDIPTGKPDWVRPHTDHGERTSTGGKGLNGAESVALRLNTGVLGFGEYLVLVGALNREQLYRVLQVKDWKQLRLGEAAVKLGYVSRRRVEMLLRKYRATLDATRLEGGGSHGDEVFT